MKTVLILAPNIAPYPGGAEIYISTLMKQLVKLGWNVICVTENPLISNECNIDYIKTCADIERITSSKTVTWREMQFSLLDQVDLQNKKIDIIHANSMEACVIGRIIADHLNVPIVASIHEHLPEQKSFGMGRIRLIFNRLDLDAVIAPSSFYYNRTLQYGFCKEKIFKVMHGVEINDNYINDDLIIENKSTLKILFIGRVYFPKGLHILIKALGQLKIEKPFFLSIVGPITDVKYMEELTFLIKKYRIEDCIKFIGAVSQDVVKKYMINSDLLIAPSINEGFGLSIVEANLMLLPVIASKVDGIIDIIEHEKTGLLFEVGNYSSLLNSIYYFLSNPHHVKTMVKNGYEKAVSQFSVDRMACETISVYNKVKESFDKNGYKEANY